MKRKREFEKNKIKKKQEKVYLLSHLDVVFPYGKETIYLLRITLLFWKVRMYTHTRSRSHEKKT